jgi:hypothetical protein
VFFALMNLGFRAPGQAFACFGVALGCFWIAVLNL